LILFLMCVDTRHYAGPAALFDGVSAVTFPVVTEH